MNPIKLLCRSHEFRKRLELGRPRLYRIAYAWCHDPAFADDLVQETLARALKNGHQLRELEAMDAWLVGIMTNCRRDHYRRKKDMEDIDDHEQALFHEDTPEAHRDKLDIKRKVNEAVARLPEGQRQVLTLVELGGFSYAEVAEIMGVPIGTVMSRLSRARQALSQLLSDFRPEQAKQPPVLRRIK